jgi:hypothetical protein
MNRRLIAMTIGDGAMKKTMKKSGISLLRVLLAVAVVTVFLGTPTMSAASTAMTVTGTILPTGHKQGLNSYVLEVQGQERVFQITDAYVLNWSGNSGTLDAWWILNRIPGHTVTVLRGDKEAIKALTEPDVLCKGVRIQGMFSPSNGTLFLAAVERAPKQDEPEICQ